MKKKWYCDIWKQMYSKVSKYNHLKSNKHNLNDLIKDFGVLEFLDYFDEEDFYSDNSDNSDSDDE